MLKTKTSETSKAPLLASSCTCVYKIMSQQPKLMALTNDRKQDDEKDQKKKDVNNWLRALKQLSQNPAGKKIQQYIAILKIFFSPSDPRHVVGVYDEYRPQGTGDADVALLSGQHHESFNIHHHKNDSLLYAQGIEEEGVLYYGLGTTRTMIVLLLFIM